MYISEHKLNGENAKYFNCHLGVCQGKYIFVNDLQTLFNVEDSYYTSQVW